MQHDLIKAVIYEPEHSATRATDPLGEEAGAYVGLVATVFRAKAVTLKAAKKQFKLGNRDALNARRKASRPAIFPGPLPRSMVHTVFFICSIAYYCFCPDFCARPYLRVHREINNPDRRRAPHFPVISSKQLRAISLTYILSIPFKSFANEFMVIYATLCALAWQRAPIKFHFLCNNNIKTI